MTYKLIVFDIDGTVTRHISSWQYLHEKINVWDDTACKYQEDFLAGRISYRKFCELDAVLWKGLSEEKIQRMILRVPYSKNARSCVKKIKKMGLKIAGISSGIHFMTDRIKQELGFDYIISNRLVTRGGILTGGVLINVSHGAKGTLLRKIIKKFKCKLDEVISVGDSEGDIPLAKLSGYCIAFNSSSTAFSNAADYVCKTDDFNEVYKKILCLCDNKDYLKLQKSRFS